MDSFFLLKFISDHDWVNHKNGLWVMSWWKLAIGNGMKNDPTKREKKQSTRHMLKLDVKGGYSLFFMNIYNTTPHPLHNGCKCV